MNIGIVTFHCSYNFGSALQAYALQTTIEKLGHSATIVDYRSQDFDSYRLMKLGRPKTMLRLLSRYQSNRKRRESFEDFWAKHLHLTNESYSYKDEERLKLLVEEFDCFVCGSDQIWNLDCTHGPVGPFFLDFAGERRRVAYAPSLAHTSFSSENYNKERVARYLSKFDSLSVRERGTLPVFQPLVDKKIDVALDPTLLLDAEEYSFMVDNHVIEGEYFFVYLLRQCPELIESVCTMAVDTGKRIVYASDKDLKIPNSVNLYGIGPEEFVSLIAHADAVLTNSFHASVFSVLFRKPFRAYSTDKSSSRMTGLLDDLSLSDYYSPTVDADPIPAADWKDVKQRLDKMRGCSIEYLRHALS